MTEPAPRCVLADDHPMVRNCISKILESQEDLEVVGKASNGVVAIEMGATAKDLANTVHAHPTLSETLMEAAELFYGHSTHAYMRKKAEPAG